jgi:predicted RNase H-like nuclease (RuvC/YqgF family)
MKEISNEELFEYLMTADFNENLRPEEWKFLLLKFREFYKNLRGNKQLLIGDLNFKTKNLEKEISALKSNLQNQQIKATDLENKIDFIKRKRKLTFKERIKGEIEKFGEIDNYR